MARLRSAGAVVLGKANMHELAAGGAVNPWFGQVINPLSSEHGTGGTSSGSAASVAAGLCSFALGTDSGGSNRSVAAACGVYGYKPSNGLISSDGVLPTAPSMDTVGLIAPSAELITQCLRVLTGDMGPDSTASLQGRTFARIGNLISSPMDAVVSDTVEFAFASIVAQGGRVRTFEVDAPDELARAGVAILRYEFAQTYGEKIDHASEKVGAAVHNFLAASRLISTSQYTDAIALAAQHRARWAVMLAEVDGLIAPTAPGLAPDLATETTAVGLTRMPYGATGAEFRMWANTIGIPAIAIPIPRASGLPASVQLSGAKNSDRLLLDLAAALGRAITQKTTALLGLLAAAPTTAKAEDTIRFGLAAEPYAPFSVKDADGNWTGWEVDLRDAVCAEMKVKCVWVEVAWDDIIPALLEKKFDVIWSSMSITDDLMKVIAFTDKYYTSAAVWVGAKSDTRVFDPANPASMDGIVVGAQNATSHAKYMEKYFTSHSELKLYDTLDNETADLKAGRIDLLMAGGIQISD